MRGANAGLFDVIVAEHVDRISRDQADYHTARKSLDHAGVAIHTASGKVGKLDGALHALMGEMFLENLALHTRRGLEGVVRDGRHAGGRAFGYRPIAGKPGELEIVEAEAAIVREIFADYVAGKTPRAIAASLNNRGVPPARGRLWNASTINGNVSRGGGILLNNLYAGQIVWNKVRMVKDPITRKRLSRPNPKDQRRVSEAPHLRIVDEATFRAAQALKIERRHEATPETAQKARAPKRVFSGLIKCGSCGGGMASIGADRKGLRVQCSAHRESASCGNGRRVYLDDIESIVIAGLRQHLEHPEVITEYVTAYNAERKRLKREATNETGRLERRAGEIEREVNRLVDSIAKGAPAEPIVPRLNQLTLERATISAALEAAKEADNVIALHPQALARYKRDVMELAEELKRGDPDTNAGVFARIRSLVTAIVVHAAPSTAGGDNMKAAEQRQIKIDLKGRLAELCDNMAVFPNVSMSGGTLVAREGLEPPTPGL